MKANSPNKNPKLIPAEKKSPVKDTLHSRNRNRERYDLDALLESTTELKRFVKPNKFGDDSIDFSNPAAVKSLNKALLKHYYGIENWSFPNENLCPPIPGRADYIHYLADLLSETNSNQIPTGSKINCLDIGVGATCIYPILGVVEYDWNFVGADIDPKSISNAKKIIHVNVSLQNKIECRLQTNSNNIFRGIIGDNDKFDLTMSNPPFHSSLEEAQKGTSRKIKNLSGKKMKTPDLNFSGNSNELIYDGGEFQFLKNMIQQSCEFKKQCLWFTSQVSKESNLTGLYKLLEINQAISVRTIPMGTGNKLSRILAWTFLSEAEQKEWRNERL